MGNALVVYVNQPTDLHHALGAVYVRAVEDRVPAGTVTYLCDWPSDAAVLRQYLDPDSSAADRRVVLLTHGCHSERQGCKDASGQHDGCQPLKNCGPVRSCAIVRAGLPVLTLGDCNLLQNTSVYAATACHLAATFGPAAIARGATAFLGYADQFWHVPVGGGHVVNPFQELIASTVTGFLQGDPLATVHQHLVKKYEYWIGYPWLPAEQPSDWWLIRMCLQYNLRSLSYLHHEP